jgi:hypothetical protein
MQTGRNKTTSTTTLRIALALCATALFLLAFAAPAMATEQHLFDPVLSLEGTCSGKDGAPDPGCVGEPPAYPAGEAPSALEAPCGTAIDPHGDIYVANPSPANVGWGTGGKVDVFNPQGVYLTEIPLSEKGPCNLAVDSKGNVYVRQLDLSRVALYKPSAYPPSHATSYSLARVFGSPTSGPCKEEGTRSVAVDPSSDHLYIGRGKCIEEYGSAAESSPLVDGEATIPPEGFDFYATDVYGKNGDIYATARNRHGGNPSIPVDYRVMVFAGSDGHLMCEIDGTETPQGKFEFSIGGVLAVDQANGDVYIFNPISSGVASVDQFAVKGEECKYVGLLPTPPTVRPLFEELGDIAVDDPIVKGEAGYDSPNEGYVYVTSGAKASSSHLYAYRPKLLNGPPKIENQGASGITETEAVLQAELNPNGLSSIYHFEYTTLADFEVNGFANATSVPVPDAKAGKGGAFVEVSEPITELEPGVTYRFRLVASNCEDEESEPGACLTKGEGKPGEEGEDASFATYSTPPFQSCSNAALRTGPAALLPDCRAYELVTPPNTNGRIPTMAMPGGVNFGNNAFDTWLASPEPGLDSLVFGSDSGALPGLGGSGDNDTYEALRDPGSGWQSHFTGMSGAQAERPANGGISPDHGYAFWFVAKGLGQLSLSTGAQYLRVPTAGPEPSPNCAPAAEPDGQFEWVGCGSLGVDPNALGKWISPRGTHVIFETSNSPFGAAQQLEPCAPATGNSAVYDRTPGGLTHCISLLPGNSAPAPNASFRGVSADGSVVAFSSGGELYARVDNEETLEVASGSPAFGGLSRNGGRVFYLGPNSAEPLLKGTGIPQGEIFACDLASGPCAGSEKTHEPVQIGSGEESVLVNVSADGSHAYFVSKKALTPGEENEAGEEAEEGKENLYVWDGAGVRFIAIVDPLDVTGKFVPQATATVGGLGLWISAALKPNPTPEDGPGDDPSRTNPEGTVLVFESRTDLIPPYRSNGHSEVFRYDTEAEPGSQLTCVSCSMTGSPATTDAQLQSNPNGQVPFVSFPPVSAITHIANVSADGKKVFFQSAEPLVLGDTDGKVDVYEWEAQETGNCEREDGCVQLISGGRSTEDDYLYAMTPSGHDVFFMSGDTLVGQDPDKTPSIYDARVEGGFPPPTPPPGECLGEACQPTAIAPDDPTPASSSFEGAGNVHEESPTGLRCPKGKHKVKTRGKVRCVKRHPKAHHRKNHRANTSRRAAR